MLLIRRVVFSVLVLLIVSIALFTLVHLVPVSPARVVLGSEATVEQINVFNHDHGLDQPILVQYWHWFSSALHGDFGKSYITNIPISGEIARSLPVTLEIVVLGFVFAVVAAVPLGLMSAFWKNSGLDNAARVISVVGVSIPGFWLGLLLISLFAIQLGWLPPGGFAPIRDGLVAHMKSVVLPAFALGFYYIAILSRTTRASMVEVLAQDYVRTARAMGLSQLRIVAYVVKNGLAPVVSVAALSFGYMFGWALIIEQVFNIAGLSRDLLLAIQSRDYLTIEAIVLIITCFFLIANIVADLLYHALTPRLATDQ